MLRSLAVDESLNASFFSTIWVNSKKDGILLPWFGDQSKRKKTLNLNQLYSALKLTLFDGGVGLINIF